MKKLTALLGIGFLILWLMPVLPVMATDNGTDPRDPDLVYIELRPDLDETKIRGQAGIPSDITRGIYSGYSLPITDHVSDNETLNYIVCVPDRWDGKSDILVHIDCAITDNETGKAYEWHLEWQHFTPNIDIIPSDYHGLTTTRNVLSEDAWQSYQDWIVIPYDLHAIDDPPDPIVSDDLIAITLSRNSVINKNDTNGEIAVFAIDVLFARGDFLADPDGNIIIVIEAWMEENMEEIGIQFGLLVTWLETWSLIAIMAFLLLIAINWLAFQQKNVFLYLLAVPVDFIYGLSFAASNTPGSAAWVLGVMVAVIGTFILYRVAVSELLPLAKRLRNK